MKINHEERKDLESEDDEEEEGEDEIELDYSSIFLSRRKRLGSGSHGGKLSQSNYLGG